MHRGYISVWRCLADNPLWYEEPFTRGQAWVDLMLIANHAEGSIRRRGIRLQIQRGEVGMSLRELSDRWRWSVGKVQRYMQDLQNMGQVHYRTDTENVTVTTLICITNYEKYQNRETEIDTEMDTQTIRRRVQNNNKNKKNKKHTGHFEGAEDIFEKCWAEYPNKDGKKEALKHFLADVKTIEEARQLIKAIYRYTEKTAGKDPQYIKNGSTFFNNWRDYAE